MANTYTKLFQSLLDSTVWQEPLPTKVVWVTMLAMCDKEGKVWASVPGLAVRAGVSIAECESALEKFKGPDSYSRTKEHEGRRIEEMDGGWQLLNHGKYRNMMSVEERREYQRIKQAEYRQKRKMLKLTDDKGDPITIRQAIARNIKPEVEADRKALLSSPAYAGHPEPELQPVDYDPAEPDEVPHGTEDEELIV